MTPSPAIRVEGLGKRYRVGQRGPAYSTLRDSLANTARRLFGHRSPTRNASDDSFWALRDVSFDVQPGEVVGLIGRNGAGKSTLLKILSRITWPTEGRVTLRGRVGSLLEVGTGFHGELTGRENIYLSGAILGMRKAEIDRKLDEIVAFAEVEQFLDTPIKHYSSGMTVRLAFAVAAHLETEILLVDEVLAVGDAEFRKRSIGKMGQVAEQGRTVIFVSHNMAMIETLCSRTIILADGRIAADGETSESIPAYLNSVRTSDAKRQVDISEMDRQISLEKSFSSARLNGRPIAGSLAVPPRTDLTLELGLTLSSRVTSAAVGVDFENNHGVCVLGTNTRWLFGRLDLRPGNYEITCRIPRLPLVPGQYGLSIYLFGNHRIIDRLDRMCNLEITSRDVYGSGELPNQKQGFYLTEAEWELAPCPSEAGIENDRLL